ncbi:MAG TPA: hypothetical protein VLI90_15920 [Tepidisphaeraceae bacterium]|nr:hypothetical protein [Tepidisphaeraceae bacterium]
MEPGSGIAPPPITATSANAWANNALFGNGGNNTPFGGGGNDQIHAKNENNDYVDGGSGNDSAVIDPIDTVVNVEMVTH